MPCFSNKSKLRLATCHKNIQDVLNEAIKYIDFSVIDGYRGKYRQDKYYRDGTSKAKYPYSKHNTKPSCAVDIVPWPTIYSDRYEFFRVAGVIMTIAQQMNVNLKWGGDWSIFQDLPHFEL